MTVCEFSEILTVILELQEFVQRRSASAAHGIKAYGRYGLCSHRDSHTSTPPCVSGRFRRRQHVRYWDYRAIVNGTRWSSEGPTRGRTGTDGASVITFAGI